jgi:hypothetical protein
MNASDAPFKSRVAVKIKLPGLRIMHYLNAVTKVLAPKRD